MKSPEELKNLYKQTSKHSGYQILSSRLSKIIKPEDLEIKTRYETERLSFILKYIDIKDKSVLDIGGNTGYFTFELIENGASSVDYYEGNKVHTDFVKLASKILNVENKVGIYNKYLLFTDELLNKHFDIVLLLNVLHHYGDDYGRNEISIENVKKDIINQLNCIASNTTALVFQMGFNWKGFRNLCLFENGTKKEMIEYIEQGIKNYWEILHIGVADSKNGAIGYSELNENNLIRKNELGEFLNRPIFILKSLRQ